MEELDAIKEDEMKKNYHKTNIYSKGERYLQDMKKIFERWIISGHLAIIIFKIKWRIRLAYRSMNLLSQGGCLWRRSIYSRWCWRGWINGFTIFMSIIFLDGIKHCINELILFNNGIWSKAKCMGFVKGKTISWNWTSLETKILLMSISYNLYPFWAYG